MNEPASIAADFQATEADATTRRDHCFGKNDSYTPLHYWLGVPTIALSAAAGAAASFRRCLSAYSRLALPFSLDFRRFLRPDAARARYRESAIEYERLREDARHVRERELASLSKGDALRKLDQLRARRFELMKGSGGLH
jgi:hypothetical protein